MPSLNSMTPEVKTEGINCGMRGPSVSKGTKMGKALRLTGSFNALESPAISTPGCNCEQSGGRGCGSGDG